MIYLAILINRLGHFIPAWINRTKFRELRSQLKWRQIFYELSGLITSFLLAFLIITVITLISVDRYLLNENAIYGVNCNPIAIEMGFRDGDKILAINEKEVEKFYDIEPDIILEYNANVKVLRNQQELVIAIDDKYIGEIIQQKKPEPLFTPRTSPIDTTITEIRPIIITESRKGVKDIFTRFRSIAEYISMIINPVKDYSNIGAFSTIVINDFKSFMMALAINLLLVGLFCLLPIPGFDLGNSLIVLLEKIRNKNFNLRRLRFVKITCVILTLIIFYLRLYMF